MLRENLKDAGEIIQNILHQPLEILGNKKNVSLLSAAENYRTAEAMTSDLRKILINFLKFQDSTEIMLRELDLIVDDLQV